MPVISSDEYSITVTLFSTKEKFEEKEEILVLNERQKYIFDTIKSQGFIQSMNIQKKFNVTRDTANRDLNYLIQLKLIKREGIGKSIRYVKV
jgi:predicted HTH transcriptional regulator